jgi:hypothetical protein
MFKVDRGRLAFTFLGVHGGDSMVMETQEDVG